MTRRRIYLCAALYAEGTSNYDFLSPLIQRLLDSLGSRLFPGLVDVGETIGIDAPRPTPAKRAERIAAAVADHWDAFTVLVIHADGAGAPEEARQNNIAPGITLAQSIFPSLIAVPCIPIREIEAWILADERVFQTLLGRGTMLSLQLTHNEMQIQNKRCAAFFKRADGDAELSASIDCSGKKSGSMH